MTVLWRVTCAGLDERGDGRVSSLPHRVGLSLSAEEVHLTKPRCRSAPRQRRAPRGSAHSD